MARAKAEKKLVSFVRANLVNKLIKDRAIVENRSESAIIEKILLEGLLPKEKDTKFIVENYLYGESGDIGKTLEMLFASNAVSVGEEWAAKHDNFENVLKFVSKESSLYNQTILTGKEPILPHMKSQFRLIVDVLKNESERKWGEALLDELEKEPQMARCTNIYQLLLNNWNEQVGVNVTIKKWSITYRLLADLAILEEWRNIPEVRTELLEVIKELSVEWQK